MPPASRALARVAAARAMYDDASVPLAQVARFLEISPQTFARRRKVWAWPPRVAASLSRQPGTSDMDDTIEMLPVTAVPGTGEPVPLASLTARLEAAIAAQLALLEAQFASGPASAVQAERQARIVATLVRTLTQARQAQRSTPGDADRPEADTPEALDDLRDELARRLAGMRGDGAIACAD